MENPLLGYGENKLFSHDWSRLVMIRIFVFENKPGLVNQDKDFSSLDKNRYRDHDQERISLLTVTKRSGRRPLFEFIVIYQICVF